MTSMTFSIVRAGVKLSKNEGKKNYILLIALLRVLFRALAN